METTERWSADAKFQELGAMSRLSFELTDTLGTPCYVSRTDEVDANHPGEFKLTIQSEAVLVDAALDAALAAYPTNPPPILRAHVFGATADPSRSLSAWAVLEEMTAAVDTNGALVLAFEGTFTALPSLVSPTVTGQLRYTIDGVPVAGSTRTVHYTTPTIALLSPGAMHFNVSLPRIRATGLAVSVTVAVEWSVTAGVLTAVGIERSLRIDQPVV